MTTTIHRNIDSKFRVMNNTKWNKQVYDTRSFKPMVRFNTCLKNIDLQINEKEVTAIIGPSGCGKSTYLKTLNRMVENVSDVKISGAISLMGRIFSGRICPLKNYVQK